MTRPSRGVPEIQEQARGRTDMTKTKAGMFPLKQKDTIKTKVIKRGFPAPATVPVGMKRGGGCMVKGHTKGALR